ncbi:MAG: uroporphyrinogen-III C-methyltransferase [Rhodospirillaceae bacterium]|jgi:uroporphyrin-III C-methyltransferase|nr:uroporphyrinogen-III C-methyltransferase [Rhodospirillaceae bacterium]MBT3810536.1 uroporphyrinogen-III C-methyltransferase [Rhodospirillaceae bacterium]MBT3929599.1 uroporphyrinogen-III C-methyltransferase [Rhodospirillaceae bacterium]MBT4772814.1 uroporphyrinogen-III C-methyltransferase [Rhodospirillaceae bacterium]MBT5360063.1 uroporphyrinogen-III C-methyltransferase [Rhodospirillaceae bacterium]
MNIDELNLPAFQPGWVWLVGAGPGDPALLTVGALHALKSADVVVHDALVGDHILSLAAADAELIYAGKRGGKPSPKQPDISARLISLARQGKRVLRLKGGDPFLFGRGGEEALALVAADVPFRIVPGVTAAIGGLAYAGIPMTHRATATAVTFVTGHNLSGKVPDDLDWSSLANGAQVLVFYMALKHIDEIIDRLIAAGRSPDTPAALVAHATTDAQQVVVTTLLEAKQAAADVSPPALFVVGEVVRLRDGLDWLGALSGRALDPDPLGHSDIRDAV